VGRDPLRSILLSALLAVCGSAGAQTPAPELTPSLRSFLQALDGRFRDGSTRISVAAADLSGKGSPVVLVYLSGRSWCGSGGCGLLILSSSSGKYRVITKTTVTQLPIKILASRTHGWRDLAVGVGGGGAAPGLAKLAFNGHRYPSNPTIAPRAPDAAAGAVLIPPDAPGAPLYP
jgi:hypothetical protein